MPDDHPDLDPFAHRDAEPEQPDADGATVDIQPGAYFVFHQRADDDAHFFSLYSYDGDCLAAGTASFGNVRVPRTFDLTVYGVRPAPQPAERAAPARPDAHPDLRVAPGGHADGDHPPGRDAGLRGAGGEPDAGAAAVPGGGAVLGAYDWPNHHAHPDHHDGSVLYLATNDKLTRVKTTTKGPGF